MDLVNVSAKFKVCIALPIPEVAFTQRTSTYVDVRQQSLLTMGDFIFRLNLSLKL